ncbi:MAG: hypothetical protein HEQ35_30835 [Gloeotrichia echinulata IR180]|jgi:hypothetical protein
MHESCLDNLLPVLRSLDQLLERAVSTANLAYGTEAETDPYRGLYINQDDVERALKRHPDSAFQGDGSGSELLFEEIGNCSSLNRLQEIFELSVFDLALVAIAFAPEIDLRYEQIYAYLQDDVTRKRPTVNLAVRSYPLLVHNLLKFLELSRNHLRFFFTCSSKLDGRISCRIVSQ